MRRQGSPNKNKQTTIISSKEGRSITWEERKLPCHENKQWKILFKKKKGNNDFFKKKKFQIRKKNTEQLREKRILHLSIVRKQILQIRKLYRTVERKQIPSLSIVRKQILQIRINRWQSFLQEEETSHKKKESFHVVKTSSENPFFLF